MIIIDLDEVMWAYCHKKIRMKDYSFLHEINGKEDPTEKQLEYLESLQRNSKPYEILKDK